VSAAAASAAEDLTVMAMLFARLIAARRCQSPIVAQVIAQAGAPPPD
jgi:hypothetical protein